jgi:hypothetical protein
MKIYIDTIMRFDCFERKNLNVPNLLRLPYNRAQAYAYIFLLNYLFQNSLRDDIRDKIMFGDLENNI